MSLFKKIIDRKIPAEIVFEDDLCLAFKDINPQAPIHILLIPKKEISSMDDIDPEKDRELLGYLMVKAHKIAKNLEIGKKGYRLVINTNEDGGQTVFHLHIHILGGRPLGWPPG